MNGQIEKSLKTLAGIVSAIAVLVGVGFAADGRYEKVGQAMQKHLDLKKELFEIRRDQVEDQLFVLEQIPEAKRTDVQRALIERLKRRLESLSKRDG